MDIFENMRKQAEEAKERWEEIEKQAEKTSEMLESVQNNNSYTYHLSRETARLVLLLVEQLKPIAKLESDDFMKKIMESLTGGK